MLKLDVEGQEHALLEAGWQQLLAYRPTIFVEVLPGTPQLRALLSRLCTELGYRCYVPTGRDLISVPVRHIPAVNLQREHGTNDLLLCARLQPSRARVGGVAEDVTTVVNVKWDDSAAADLTYRDNAGRVEMRSRSSRSP